MKEEQFTPVPVYCPMDEFENAIRKIGVIAACEWFGYHSTSDFTQETLKIFRGVESQLKKQLDFHQKAC